MKSGLCASQHWCVQKVRASRLRLHVETVHFTYGPPKAMGFLQTLHLPQLLVSAVMLKA